MANYVESVCGIPLLSLRARPGKEVAGLCEHLLAASPEVLAINFFSVMNFALYLWFLKGHLNVKYFC